MYLDISKKKHAAHVNSKPKNKQSENHPNPFRMDVASGDIDENEWVVQQTQYTTP